MKTDLFKGVFDEGIDTVEFSQQKRTELTNKLCEMIEEEQIVQVSETRAVEEIPEDTPHYLNPQVLKGEEKAFSYDAEEGCGDDETDWGNVKDIKESFDDLGYTDFKNNSCN